MICLRELKLSFRPVDKVSKYIQNPQSERNQGSLKRLLNCQRKKKKRYATQSSPPPLPPIKKLKGQGKAEGGGSSESEDPPQDLGTSGPEGTCCQQSHPIIVGPASFSTRRGGSKILHLSEGKEASVQKLVS